MRGICVGEKMSGNYTMIVHPFAYPFLDALMQDKNDAVVFKLWNEFDRKMEIGRKRNIEKWQWKPLLDEYTRKLKAL